MNPEGLVYRAVYNRANLPDSKFSGMEVRQTALPYDAMD